MTDRLSSARITAGVFFLVAAFVGLSIALAFAAPQSQNLTVILLRAPGVFLVESFHLASLYVPAILCVGAGLLLAERLLPLHIAMLLASTVPFFTAATAVRIAARASVASSPVTATLVDGLGLGGALVVTVALALAELALLALLWYRTRARFTRPVARGGSMTAGMRRIQALLDAPDRGGEAFAGGATVAHPPAPAEPAAPASLVDLPDPEVEPDAPSEADTAAPSRQPARAGRASGHAGRRGYDLLLPRRALRRPGRPRIGDDWPDDGEDDEDDDAEAEALVEEVDVPAPPRSSRYDVPIDGLLLAYSDKQYWRVDERTREAAETLRVTLDEFGIQAEVTGIRKGPVITMFEILPAPGVKLSKIVNLSDNIALRLAASSVRIVAPIPGKHAVGIEIPNKERAIVGFAELLQEESFQGPRMRSLSRSVRISPATRRSST